MYFFRFRKPISLGSVRCLTNKNTSSKFVKNRKHTRKSVSPTALHLRQTNAAETRKFFGYLSSGRIINAMEDVKDIHITPLPDSPYVKPFRFNYTQNGKTKSRDILEVHDGVCIVVFNVSRRKMIFVKQFRPAIYFNCVAPADRQKRIDHVKYPARLGISLEMCAGIVDKNKPLEEIAKEEVLEECGYDVKVEDLQRITSYRSGVGVQGALQTFYYCEVEDSMKTTDGGGVDDEIIDVVEMSIEEVEELVNSPGPLSSPPSCLFALLWFLHNKADRFRK